MNNSRRAKLSRALDYLDEAMEWVQQVAEEEQDAFDNLPESLQLSENGEKMEDFVSRISDVYDYLDDQVNELNDIINT